MFGHRRGCDHSRMHQGHERQHRGGGLFERGGRREGGRGGRMFEQGGLRLVILKLLQEKSRHGYEVIKAIEELVGGDYSPSPGVIYPTLTLLEELGYTAIEAESGGKKLFRITPEGAAFLAANSEALAQALQRLETAQRASGSSAPELRRAIQNFRMALHTRLERGELSQEQIRAMVDAIDLAAVKIERI